jgi:hypothetical protein
MRSGTGRRILGVLATAALAACGGSGSPTAPEMPVVIATGPQILRITFQGSCNSPDGRPFLPLVYSRVVVSRAGNEWVGTAAAPDAGDVELRFHVSGLGALAGSVPVAGAIRGTAIHIPELLPAAPPSTTRVSFGSDGRTALNGFAFSPSSLTPAAGVSGIGSGTITVSDNEGRSCSGTAFSWGLGPRS